MASLLLLGVSGAYDNVSHQRLLHNLKKRQLDTTMVKLIRTFLTNRTNTLSLMDTSQPPTLQILEYHKELVTLLNSIQAKAVRITGGAFKATSIPALNVETHLLPMKQQTLEGKKPSARNDTLFYYLAESKAEPDHRI